MFHNAKEQLARGAGPYFYLPKLESHLEARLWNEVFVMTQQALGLPQGTIKATVLIETILAAFEMDEILYELREHSAGLNAGRWDYIFSCIKKFKLDKDFCLADRATVTMTAPFMRAYALLAAEDLPPARRAGDRRHERADPDQERSGEKRDRDGRASSPTSGATPKTATTAAGSRTRGWSRPAMKEFVTVLGDRPNQFEKQKPEVHVTAADLLDFEPEKPITEAGLRMNINVGIHYLGAWLAGNGCVPIHNLMEDAATAEISRSQVWQWIRSPKGVLDDGRKVTAALVRQLVPEELAKIKAGGSSASSIVPREIFDADEHAGIVRGVPDAAAVRGDLRPGRRIVRSLDGWASGPASPPPACWRSRLAPCWRRALPWPPARASTARRWMRACDLRTTCTGGPTGPG